jgi:hypothetical protein
VRHSLVQYRITCRWLVLLSAALTALAAVLALVLPAGQASAAAAAAGNGVGASHPQMILAVGSFRPVSADQSRDNACPQARFASGLCVAAEDTAGGTTQVFRTVGSAEARDIAESGVYRNPEGLEGKYFYPTQAQAENLGAQYAKMGLGEQTLTSGRISTDLLNQFGEPISPAGEGPAFFLRNDVLPNIFGVTIEGPLP